MNQLILAIHTLLVLLAPGTHALAAGVHRTAPSYLTSETATDNARAATIAAIAYDLDPALLLSIGHHESRYQAGTVTPEEGGKFSCGAMTPEPTRDREVCNQATSSLLGGYLAGARHLRGWLKVCRGHERCALLGYAGGFRLLQICSDHDARACHTPEVFRARARWIQRSQPGRASPGTLRTIRGAVS